MVIANIDVPLTKITFSDTTNYSIVSDTCEYYVENGICTALLYVKCETPSTNWITVANVPKAKTMNQYKILVNPDGDKILKCVFKPDGSLQFSKGVAGTSYIGTVSYPVTYD